MPSKTPSETRDLLRLMVKNYDDARSYLDGDFRQNMSDVIDEIPVGTESDWKSLALLEAENLREIGNAFWVAHRIFMRNIAMALADVAGGEPLGDEAAAISTFNDYLNDEGESVPSLGLTHDPFQADAGNVGDAVVVELFVGADGTTLDCGHNEELTLHCDSINPVGLANWRLNGEERQYFLFDDDRGTGNQDGGYAFDWGAGEHEFTRSVSTFTTSTRPQLQEWGSNSDSNMLKNGDFRSEIASGPRKIAGAVILDGEANVDLTVTNPIFGNQSLQLSGDMEMEWATPGARVGRPEFIHMLVRRNGTFTGTLRIRFRSFDTDGTPINHVLVEQDIATMTAGDVVPLSIPFVVPNSLGDRPVVYLEVDGSGGTGSLDVDNLTRGVLSLFDSNRAIAVVRGPTRSRKGDKFVGGNTITDPTPIQRMFNECFGRSVRHSAGGDFWTMS
jgi:hypothetical protein